MKKINILISLAAASILFTACGGGGGTTPTPTPVQGSDLTFVTSTETVNVMKDQFKSMRVSLGTSLLVLGEYEYDFTITDKSTNITFAQIDAKQGRLLFLAPSGEGETCSITVTATDKSNGTGSVTLNFVTVDGSNVSQSAVIKTGDDADGAYGEPRNFTKESLFSNVSGVNNLIWADKVTNVEDNVIGETYLDAKDHCELTVTGMDDGSWRLPTVSELLDTVNYGKVVNAGTKVYDNFDVEILTSWAEKVNGREFYLHNVSATITENLTNSKFMTRCVKEDVGYIDTTEHLIYVDKNIEDTFDLSTGFQWSPVEMMAVANDVAKNYCEASMRGGHDNWRLPNINELRSVVENGSISSYITSGTQLISGTAYNDGDDSTSLNWGIWLNPDVTASVAQMYTVDLETSEANNFPVTCVRPIN